MTFIASLLQISFTKCQSYHLSILQWLKLPQVHASNSSTAPEIVEQIVVGPMHPGQLCPGQMQPDIGNLHQFFTSLSYHDIIIHPIPSG